jgi:Kef-type K+ transport system membrane component KefB
MPPVRNMTPFDSVTLAVQLASMFAVATVLGRAMRAVGQPPVLGEMLAGVVLGPTVFGTLWPHLHTSLFTASPDVAAMRSTVVGTGMLMFLFTAGLATNLSAAGQRYAPAIIVGLVGTLLPIAAGMALVFSLPPAFWGEIPGARVGALALFVGMTLANSANPVLARILMDLGALRSPIGAVCMAASAVDDLVNWTLFTVVLGGMTPIAWLNLPPAVAPWMALISCGAAIVLLCRCGEHLLDRISLRWLAVVTVIAIAVIAGNLAKAAGLHAFIGAYAAGVALSRSAARQGAAYEVVDRLGANLFAPLYFVSMGLSINFVSHFDVVLAAVILGAAVVTKIGAVLLGVRLAGMRIDRTAWAIAWGLNARGATGLVLAGVGLSTGVIDERLFVAMVTMCLVTSFIAAPGMKAALAPRAIVGGLSSRPAVDDPAPV